MKNKFLTLITLGLGVVALNAQKKEDIEAIKSMVGCYKVSFNFSETFSTSKEYQRDKNHSSRAIEWVTVAEETPKKIVLQHILIIDPEGKGKDALVKHWRQDWLYENTDLYTFHKDNLWKYKKLDTKDVKGQWTQVVYQVDDAPRYSASGTWVHLDGKKYWETNADAPMPRRDLKRKDYNVLNRNNRHEIFDWGWLHEQDNKKILRQDGAEDKVVVEEKGMEYYRKIEREKCAVAENYWKEYAPLWKTVRDTWDTRLAKKSDMEVKSGVSDVYLYGDLMKLNPNQHKEAEKLVNDYITK